MRGVNNFSNVRSRGRGRGRGGWNRARGRGRGRGRPSYNHFDGHSSLTPEKDTLRHDRGNLAALSSFLHSLSGASYPAYKGLRGAWSLSPAATLIFDRIQSDAYAPPSRARVRVLLSEAGFDQQAYVNAVREIGFCDWLTRKFSQVSHTRRLDARAPRGGWSSLKGGDISVDRPGQHVLQRTSCLLITDEENPCIELRFMVNLPASGRSIEGAAAAHSLTELLPEVVNDVLFAQTSDSEDLLQHVKSVEDQEYLRETKLEELGLIAFVANGAILPRNSGASDRPMSEENAVKFESPEGLAVEIELPSGRKLRGMGIKPGISLIVGGGFHGKSTLLSALQVGMYNHVPGDGREFVCVHKDTVSIRAEDGRSVTGVDITPFINNLPFGKETSNFCTPDASGSTSQATNIVEALEAGAKVLLTDEDLAATNFMMRDKRMQDLVPSAKEPITPMIQRIRGLYEQEGVSSILVVGGAGDYFEVSDLVVMMDSYIPQDVTKEAKAIAAKVPSGLQLASAPTGIFKPKRKRKIACKSVQQISKSGKGKVTVRMKQKIEFGSTEIDLSAVSQIVESSQTRVIASALQAFGDMEILEKEGVTACVQKLNDMIDEHGLDAVNQFGELLGTYSRPRPIEVQAALNRLRGVEILE